jgi:hypothetical protein
MTFDLDGQSTPTFATRLSCGNEISVDRPWREAAAAVAQAEGLRPGNFLVRLMVQQLQSPLDLFRSS